MESMTFATKFGKKGKGSVFWKRKSLKIIIII